MKEKMFFPKKSLSDELFLGLFNYLHDSNSIFLAGRIKSENVFGRTVQLQLQVVFLRCPIGIMLQSDWRAGCAMQSILRNRSLLCFI